MKKLLLTIFLSLILIGSASSEEKDNSHLQNNFDTYPSCEEHVGVVFKEKYLPSLFPENKLVSCNPEINLPNEWVKTITPIKKFAKVRLDNANIRAYPFVWSLSGFHVGNLEIGEVIFIDSLVYTSLEKGDEWYRSWYSFKVDGKVFYIWKDSVDFDYKISDDQETSAYKIGEEVFLNACTANPDTYYDKPLNIKDIVIEVPNKINNLKKSKYNREFQTLASSEIILDNGKIDISVSNFRDLTIKNSNGDVLVTRKISGASSIYELKHKGEVVAWGVGWHANCGNVYDVDFTVLRLFMPVIEEGKIKIQQKLVSLNLNKTYKTIIETENLVLSDAIDLLGSAMASYNYFAGSFFYEINKRDGLKYFLDFEDLEKNINLEGLEPVQRITTLAKYNQVALLETYTKENFDFIYKDLKDNYWFDVLGEWEDHRKDNSNLKDRYDLLNRDQPFPDSEIALLKKTCFEKSGYKDLEDLVRNCFYWHSSIIIRSLLDITE
jgi:hypothetical protein